MMAIMPTTLLGVLPVGLLLVRGGSITPAELAMGIILSLSIVAVSYTHLDVYKRQHQGQSRLCGLHPHRQIARS